MCARSGTSRLSDEEKRKMLALNLIKNLKPDTDPNMAKAVALAVQSVLDGKVN